MEKKLSLSTILNFGPMYEQSSPRSRPVRVEPSVPRKQEARAETFSPKEMNRQFERGFESRGWHEQQIAFWVTHNERLLRKIQSKSGDEQRPTIEEAGYDPIRTYNQTDFVQERVAVEV